MLAAPQNPGAMVLGDDAHNAAWIAALRTERGCVHGGWAEFAPQVELRRFDDGRSASEEEFMEAYGFASYWTKWEAAAPIDDRPTAWQEALAQFGLLSLRTVSKAIQPRGQPHFDRTAKESARALIVQLLTRDLAYNQQIMSPEAAGVWADQFLAPVLDDTPLYTGTADTATINSGVVFVLGLADGGEGSSVGCLWFGDED
eukprot:TRINITY_DN106663_c0_g1_i1.p1 TRINITY_DN106663_c0_g1~~TRINITY_DN106663_c0_g1_i1.p1  ORF type:complete len:201 (+),score=29.32 TRINITY_DN106663_c0_g1_i1:131-733(+)